MKFIPLETEAQIEEIKQAKCVNVIFKHNTTCPISKGVLSRFEEEANSLKGVQSVYLLDLQSYREISEKISVEFNVKHQSPQLLVIKDGICTYDEALYEISVEATSRAISDH